MATELPELSDSEKRWLALKRIDLLERFHLTGEHFGWLEEPFGWLEPGRERIFRIARQSVWAARGSVDTEDGTGIGQTVAFAEARFRDLSGKYQRRWINFGDRDESYARWLEQLKVIVSAEVASLWRGGSEGHDRWYLRACQPAVEKVLADLVKEGTKRARHAELKRLETWERPNVDSGKAAEAEGVPPIMALPGQPAKPANGADGDGARWQDIEISFLSDERVQIRNGTKTETCNYAELGFADRRAKRGKPKAKQAWIALRAMAEQNGIIRDSAKTGADWPKVEKRIQQMRKVFRDHFKITADPIPFIEGTGYRACFKIGCSPSFST
jgi:hypothetical protein